MGALRELALFAGTGGGILGGLLSGFTTVCAVEVEPYCREVLLRRQRDRVLPLFPIWDDVRTFDGRPWRGLVDVISAGFPCQPFSVAGKSLGIDDHRNLWPETIRIIREVGPRFAFLENVPGLLAHDYFGTILGDLAEAGFDAEWDVVSAQEVGAPHKRERLWILASNTNSRGWTTGGRKCSKMGRAEFLAGDGQNGIVAHALRQGLEERFPSTESARKSQPRTGPCDWWAAEPGMGRVADGVAKRVDRLKSLGNGQVPRVAAVAWERLAGGGGGQAMSPEREAEIRRSLELVGVAYFADGSELLAEIDRLRAENARLRDAAGRALDHAENLTGWFGGEDADSVPVEVQWIIDALKAALGDKE